MTSTRKVFICQVCHTDFTIKDENYLNMEKQKLSISCPRCKITVYSFNETWLRKHLGVIRKKGDGK